MEALIKIGKPASLECLNRIATESPNEEDYRIRVHAMIRILIRVEGDDVSLFMLKNAVDKEQDKDRKAHLAAVLEFITTGGRKEAEEYQRRWEKEHGVPFPASGAPPATTAPAASNEAPATGTGAGGGSSTPATPANP